MRLFRSGFTAIKPLLKKLGLDEKETDVYLSVLSLKTARVSAIAKAARQSRSHTYLVLRALMARGLVSEIERGKVLQFVAEPPERLMTHLQDRRRELDELEPLVQGALPLLRGMAGSIAGQPRVTLLKGLEGMKQVYRDILVQEFQGMMDVQQMYDAFGTTVADVLFRGPVELRGQDLLVDNRGARRYRKEWPDTDAYRVRLLPKGMRLSTDMLIYGDTVVLFAYDDEKTMIRIENRNVAESFRGIFTELWEHSRAG